MLNPRQDLMYLSEQIIGSCELLYCNDLLLIPEIVLVHLDFANACMWQEENCKHHIPYLQKK